MFVRVTVTFSGATDTDTSQNSFKTIYPILLKFIKA